MRIYCKLIKDWSRFKEGEELWIGQPKAGSLRQQGILYFVDPQPKEEEKARPQAEVAMMKPPAETAEVTPETKTKKANKKRNAKPN